MIALGLKLTQAGVGDYWDDVDRWTRNMFTEGQLTPSKIDWLERRAAELPPSGRDQPGGGMAMPSPGFNPMHQTTDRVLERNVGAYTGWPKANEWFAGDVYGGIAHCCTGNAMRSIYYVWEDILTRNDRQLSVNLLLNRASKWADVDSHVPYVGQVDVRIKQSVDLSIRIPDWVKPAEARVRVNGEDRRVDWKGRYAVVGEVAPGDVATMTFPIGERANTVWVEKKKYEVVRKGNDVVAIDPPGRYCPLYQRDHYRQNTTRWRKAERFVSAQHLYW